MATETLTEYARSDRLVVGCMALVDDLQAAQLPAPAQRRAIRIGAGATLRDVAGELRVTPMTILRWERGDADPRRPHATAYRRLLDALRAAT